MTNKANKQTLVGFLILPLIAACVVAIVFGCWQHVRPAKVQKSYLAERWAVERHKLHGIDVSRGDYETGESWFYDSKGRRAKL